MWRRRAEIPRAYREVEGKDWSCVIRHRRLALRKQGVSSCLGCRLPRARYLISLVLVFQLYNGNNISFGPICLDSKIEKTGLFHCVRMQCLAQQGPQLSPELLGAVLMPVWKGEGETGKKAGLSRESLPPARQRPVSLTRNMEEDGRGI